MKATDNICNFNKEEFKKIIGRLYKRNNKYFILKNNNNSERFFFRITNNFFIEVVDNRFKK